MKKFIEEYWQLIVAIVIVTFICCLMFSGCSSTNHLRETTKMVQVDTVYISSVEHDTIKTVEVVHDSVDRVVEITTYVDSNGVVHQKEIEKLTRYINRNAEVYESATRLLEQSISQLKEQLQNKQETKVIEKKVYLWWPSLIIIVFCVAGFCFYKIKKRKK